MKKIISAANNLVKLQQHGFDEKAVVSFSLFNDKDKKAILNTIQLLHDRIFCVILTNQ